MGRYDSLAALAVPALVLASGMAVPQPAAPTHAPEAKPKRRTQKGPSRAVTLPVSVSLVDGVRTVVVPLVTQSEANRSQREHWGSVDKRVKKQHTITGQALLVLQTMHGFPSLPATVTLTRIAPCELDDDNLRPALKAVRDQVATWLALSSDRDPRVMWAYGQRKDAPRTYGVELRFEGRGEAE